MIKLLKTINKKKILKASRSKNRNTLCKELQKEEKKANFSSATMQARRQINMFKD